MDAFTLLEMLIAISILAILVASSSLLIQKSIESAERVKSVGQIRQIGSAFLLYRAENNGLGPLDLRDKGNKSCSKWFWGKDRLIMFGLLFPYLGIESKPVPTTTPPLFISPTSSDEWIKTISQPGSPETSYWLNPDVTSTANLRTAAIPQRRVAICDLCKWWDPLPSYNNEGKGLHVFRMDGSLEWIDIEKTRDLPVWDWSRLDDI